MNEIHSSQIIPHVPQQNTATRDSTIVLNLTKEINSTTTKPITKDQTHSKCLSSVDIEKRRASLNPAYRYQIPNEQSRDINSLTLLSFALTGIALLIAGIVFSLFLLSILGLVMISSAAIIVGSVLGIIASVAGISLGVIGIFQAKKRNEGGWGYAVAGIVLGMIAFLFSVALLLSAKDE